MENKCVICGAAIPEGIMVCPNCENKRQRIIDGKMDLNTATEQAYKNGYEQGQKDAAKKFLNMIYWKAVKHIKGKNKDECFIEISFEKLDEIAKQLGVDDGK